ncbi:MAG: hypothetical protein OXT09_21120 [Myxococcales bacterium]|nr:hypothetical protein [Myxococcales bacterium]
MTKRITPMIDDPAEPEYVRELIEAGRNDAVADYDYSKGLAALVAGIEAGTPVPDWAQGLDAASTTATTGTQAALGGAAAVSTSAVGWVVGSVVAVGLAAVAVFSGDSEEPAQIAEPEVAPVVAPAAPAAPVEPSTPAERPAPAVAEVEVAQPAPVAPEASAKPARRVARKAARPDKAAGTVAKALEEKAEPSRDLDTLMQEKVDHKASRRTKRSTSRVARAEQAPVAEEEELAPSEASPAVVQRPQYDDARLEREMRMLKVAESLLKKNPQRALSMARQGEKEFPGSMFTQERQQVRLLALVQLGRMDEARRLAKPYLKKYPRGPFSDRVRRALATGTIGR